MLPPRHVLFFDGRRHARARVGLIQTCRNAWQDRRRARACAGLTFAARALLPALLIVASAGFAAAADCSKLIADFNKAVDTGHEAEAQQLVDKIATDAECGRFQVAAQRRLSAFRLSAVQFLMARGRPPADFERLLVAADKPRVLWQSAATMAEVRFGERRFAEAARAYDRAIEIIKNESLTPTAPSKFEIQGLIDRSAQARILAANVRQDEKGPAFVKTARNERDGTLGGVYSESVRGIVPRAVPVPITFEYNKTDFTEVGSQAAEELLTALKEQRPTQLTLVGHTDVRGTPEHNLKLSKDRAAAVAKFLREHGLEIPVAVVGKGETEPMRIIDASGLTQEDIYALNRRVEWRRE
jgi:outer membrane protein OmpA-like peptidoglycan-associated protein